MTTALFIGRFQPIHNGHIKIIKKILNENDKIIIAIGSTQLSNQATNPFSSLERKDMIEKALQQEMIHYYEIIEIPDINNNEKWVDHVKCNAPKFDIVYTMNPLVKKLFEAKDICVQWLEKIPGISSTEVRKRIGEDANWQELVPEIVKKEIQRFNGIERVKSYNHPGS